MYVVLYVCVYLVHNGCDNTSKNKTPPTTRNNQETNGTSLLAVTVLMV